MKTHTTTGLRCLAGSAGTVFLSGTAVLIFGDVFRGAALTEKHFIAAVIIAGTMLVGHLSYEAWRNGKYPSSVSFGFLFPSALPWLCCRRRGARAKPWH